MIFHTITSPDDVSDFLYRRIVEHLKKGDTTWFIPGGSGIPVAAEVSARL